MRRFLFCLTLTILANGPITTQPAMAGEVKIGAIEIVHPWARPTLPNRPGVVYLGVHNNGAEDDRLIGARAEGVETVELHLASQEDGVMKMAPVEAIELPAGGMAHLGPGGYHLMLFGIAAPLKEGDSLHVTLIFEAAGEVALDVPVSKKGGDPAHEGHGDGQGHGHGKGHGHSTGN